MVISSEEYLVEAPVGDELVDEQPLLLFQADADKLDEVLVPQLGHQGQLVLQLIHPLPRALRQALHRYLVAVRENTLNIPNGFFISPEISMLLEVQTQ